MGQRLNIEIMSGDKVLANAYYHWSAYSETAIEMTKNIINEYYEIDEKNEIFKAVKLLECTGAGINDKERNFIKNNPLLNSLTIQNCINRYEGLLSVSEEGIQETRYWEEGRVTIHIDTETFDFNVLSRIRIDKYEEVYERKIEDVPFIENFSFDNIPFSDIDKVIEIINKYKECNIRYPNTNFVITFIY